MLVGSEQILAAGIHVVISSLEIHREAGSLILQGPLKSVAHGQGSWGC